MSDSRKIGVVELSKYFFSQLRWQFLNGIAKTEKIGFKEGKDHIEVRFQPVYFEEAMHIAYDGMNDFQLTEDAFAFAIEQLFGGMDYVISDALNVTSTFVKGNVVLRF